jgi:hypothetical protein
MNGLLVPDVETHTRFLETPMHDNLSSPRTNPSELINERPCKTRLFLDVNKGRHRWCRGGRPSESLEMRSWI